MAASGTRPQEMCNYRKTKKKRAKLNLQVHALPLEEKQKEKKQRVHLALAGQVLSAATNWLKCISLAFWDAIFATKNTPFARIEEQGTDATPRKTSRKKLKIEVATKSASRRTCLGTDASPLVDGFVRGYLPAMNCALERGREVKEREREEWRWRNR